MAWRILCMSDVSECPDVLDPLRHIGEVVTLPPVQQVFNRHIGEYDAYLASLHLRVDRAMLEHAKRLCVIATPSTGHDHLDVDAMRELGIELISLRSDIELLNQITATAEMAWCLLLAVMRRLPWAFEAARRGDWARDGFRGHQLSGKTLGILGYGRLGRIVAQYGAAFRIARAGFRCANRGNGPSRRVGRLRSAAGRIRRAFNPYSLDREIIEG